VTEPGDRIELEAALAGIDGARPLPDGLRANLEELLRAGSPVAALVSLAADGTSAAGMPTDVRARVEASLLAPAGSMPRTMWRRLLRALPGPAVASRGWLGTETMLVRVAAVAAAVLLVSGLAVAATLRGPAPEAQRPTVAAGPPPMETTVPEPTVAPEPTTTTTKPARKKKQVDPPRALVAYRSCADLLEETKQRVLAVVGPYGLSQPPRVVAVPAGTGSAAFDLPEALVDPFSETNVQEAGVDEPDVVKTDGRRIVTLTGASLRVTVRDPASGELASAGRLDLPSDAQDAELLLAGNRAVLFSRRADLRAVPTTADAPARNQLPAAGAGQPNGTMATGPVGSWSIVRVVDLTDPGAMRTVSTLYLEGTYTTARLASGRVRVVVDTPNLGPVFTRPADNTDEAKAAALARNQELVAASTAEDWTPRYVLVDGDDPATARGGKLCACDDVLRPQEFAGIGTISVLTIDPANPVPTDTRNPGTTVQGSADTVYASGSNLFVASHPFGPRPFEVGGPAPIAETTVHRFDIRGTAPASYAGSGKVPGTPLNQWALSERAGHLRIATTKTRAAPETGTESFVTVLAIGSTSLDQVGQVGGLGHTNERIQGVRFVGALGYVVTFRQTDPLYVVDLDDPTNPTVRGELQVSGYSAYLHPLEDGYLLGVGQEASSGGRPAGSQISSYDVRQPEQPSQIDRLPIVASGSSSAVETDHRAFLYWPATRTVVLPYQSYVYDQQSGKWKNQTGALAVGVGNDYKLHDLGRITHDGRIAGGQYWSTAIRRSLVIGDTLVTMSRSGLLTSDLLSLADQQWLAFGP
jgi:hypothetical protein